MKTTMRFVQNKQDIKWYVIDAKDVVLGRLATNIALLLKGKNEILYTPHTDPQVGVVVLNIDGVVLTGNKKEKKRYFHYTGYPGGDYYLSYDEEFDADYTRPIRRAVKNMLARNKMRSTLMRRLKVYRGTDQPHQAQKLIEYKIDRALKEKE